MDYYEKYLKYKMKYLELKDMVGGVKEPSKSSTSSIRHAPYHKPANSVEQQRAPNAPAPVVLPNPPLIFGPMPFNQEDDPIGPIKTNLNKISGECDDLPQNENVENTLNAYKIFFDSVDNKSHVTLEPYDNFGYFVNHPDGEAKIVVFYKLTYEQDASVDPSSVFLEAKKFEAIIPYYISDGMTNDFRGGMLFPFICIHDGTADSHCPVSAEKAGLLYKYQIAQNINMRTYVNWIVSELDKKNYGKHLGIDRDKAMKYRDDINCRTSRYGLASVLPRLENLLDFLIAIYSDRLFHYVPGLQNPITRVSNKPNYVKDTYEKSFAPAIEKKEPNNYNYNRDFSRVHLPLYHYNYSYPYVQIIIKPFVRNKLRELFFDMAYNFINTNIIQVEQKRLTMKKMTVNQLNETIKICIPINNVNNVLQQNYLNYRHISENLYDNFWNKINNIYETIKQQIQQIDQQIQQLQQQQQIQQLQQQQQQLQLLRKFCKFLDEFKFVNNGWHNYDLNLNEHISGWKAECKKR
jgi:hypothetical protein